MSADLPGGGDMRDLRGREVARRAAASQCEVLRCAQRRRVAAESEVHRKLGEDAGA